MAVDREKVLASAQKLVDKKRYDKAIAEYRKLVAKDPNDVRTLLKIGDLYSKLDQHESAIETYEQVGEYYYREGFSVKAIAVYKQIRGIIRRHASHLENRYGHIVPRLAEIYTQLGLTSDALAAYDEVATRLRQEGRERDALDIFLKVLDLDPQNPIAHLRVADSRARLGDIDKAVERFGEASQIMVKLGRHDDALKVLERLLEYRADPTHARAAGQLYLDRGGPNDGMAALTKLQIAFKADPKDLDTLAMLARAFDAINQPKKAIEVLKESARIAKEKNDIEALNALVDTLTQRAPEDTLVGKLDKFRRAAAEPQTEDIDVEIISEVALGADALESMDEVFELDDADIVEAVVEEAADSDLFNAGEGGDDSGVRRLINEAERQRNGGQIQDAIRLLRDGLLNLGSSTALRHRLSDLLLEAGDTVGSLTEKLILSQELANVGDIDGALETLDEVLLLQPGQPDAIQMRANLGFPVDPGYPPHDQSVDDLQLNQPLQSYDVESGGVEEALHRGQHHSAPMMPPAALDDPFGGGQPPAPHGAHPPAQVAPGAEHHAMAQPPARYDIPSGYLDENALDQAESLAEQGLLDQARTILHGQLQALPNHPLILERLADIDAIAASSQSGPHAAVPAPAVSQPLAVDQGGYPAAPTGGYPAEGYPAEEYPAEGYPAEEYPAEGYPAEEYPAEGYPAEGYPAEGYPAEEYPAEGYPAEEHPAEGYPAEEYPGAAGYPQPQAEAYPPPHAGYDAPPSYDAPPAYDNYDYPGSDVRAHPGADHAAEANAVLDEVRVGVRAQVDESDAATHYDLGVAYHEMGLHNDAISELTLASRDPAREVVCLSLIGTIKLTLGEVDVALETLQRALHSEHKTREQEVAIGYEIANTYEMKMMPEQALQYFEWLAQVDPSYADPRGHVSERVNRLRTESGAQRRPEGPPAAPDGAEVSEAYDDMYEEGK